MFRHLSACLSLLLSCVALAAAPQPPAVDARSWLLMDATSGQSIASRNPKERIEPASLTKLMTAYLAFAALKGRSLADRKSTRLNSSHGYISYAVFCLKKKNTERVSTVVVALTARR